jgi:hypothetical protein
MFKPIRKPLEITSTFFNIYENIEENDSFIEE